MDIRVQEVVSRLKEAHNLDSLKILYARILADLGISRFTYGGVRLPRSGSTEPVVLTTYPENWVQQYVECGYQAVDPVVRTGLASFLPFSWAEIKPSMKRQREMLEEGRCAGLISGMSVPIHGVAAEMALISLSSEMSTNEFGRFLNFHAHSLHVLALHFHACVADITSRGVVLPHVHLTKRETEVLTWVAHGKTTWEVSEILRLSEATIVFHVENAKTKLGVSTRSYAVAMALRLGLITI